MRHSFILILIAASLLSGTDSFSQSPETNFQKYRSSLYKIIVVERKSGEKSSSGSGFLVSQDGLIATNYHVVSDFLLEPEKYKLESIDSKGARESLAVVNFDILNDLAVLKGAGLRNDSFFRISTEPPPHGSKLYAIGDPHDVGMTIVEGNYNGLFENSFRAQFNFSGSLNRGMSGGPAILGTGDVVGVNVATMGNQVSFLVPGKFLDALIRREGTRTDPDQVLQEVERQLSKGQDEYMKNLLDSKWDLKEFGPASVPDKLSPVFQTWGENNESSLHLLYRKYRFSSYVDNNTYVARSLTTGKIAYQYYWLKSCGLNETRFYNLVSEYFEKYLKPDSNDEKQFFEYSVNSDFVNCGGMNWKINYCVRNYRKYPSLYDIVVNMSSLDKSDSALVVMLTLTGVSKENGLAFSRKFLENIRWLQ